jgi:hypothetical protein
LAEREECRSGQPGDGPLKYCQTVDMATRETVVRLRPALEVAPDCLGLEIQAELAGSTFVVGFPVHDGRPGSAIFMAPPSASQGLREEPWDGMDPWAGEHRMTEAGDIISYSIEKVVLFGAPSGASQRDLMVHSARLGIALDDWYTRFYSWLELWTTQGINHDQWPQSGIRTQGKGRDDAGREYEWGNWGVHRIYSGGGTSGPYASSEIVRAAASMSNAGRRPSLAWELLRRARGLQDTEARQRVIDAATAAEVAVEKVLFDFYSEKGITGEQLEATLKPFTGITEKLRLAEKLHPPSKSLAGRVADRIAGPLNKAAHGGWWPDSETVDRCLETAADLLAVYDPLPLPNDAQ